MSLLDAVDDFMVRADEVVPQATRRKMIKLYGEGLKAKARQVDFALQNLTALENLADESTTNTEVEEGSYQSQVEFYCDSFWAFLYACLDVLGQVVNQGMKLGRDEESVSFKKIAKHLKDNHVGLPAQIAFAKCLRSHPFTNLAAYRQCSLHRRHICFEETTTRTSMQAGYQSDTGGGSLTVARCLCDNPRDTKPKMTRHRMIPEYLQETRDKVFAQIERILSSTTAVR